MATGLQPHDVTLDSRAIFDRYHAAWESADASRIAGLHSADSSFWLQDGSERIVGRDKLRSHYERLFASYGRFGWDIKRTLFGDRHWVFEYDMLIDMTEPGGQPFTGRIPMLDIVDINDAGEVARKDVFVDREARLAALSRAGIA